MEQSPSSPGNNAESLPLSPRQSGELRDQVSSQETLSGAVAERQEQRAGAPPSDQPAVLPIVVPIAVNSTTDTIMQATTPSTTSPLIASDDERIENEWVDKAKKIIAETRDDPYRREQEVTRLQADYLAKRYGRELESAA